MALAPVGPHSKDFHSSISAESMITIESIEKVVNDIISRAPEEVMLTARRVVLDLDEEYIEHVLKRMDKNQISLLMKHIDRIKLLAEKVLIDQA